MMKAGDYNTVIPRLFQIIERNPSSKTSIEARYRLGEAYHKVGGYRDAIEMYREYIRLAPDGPFAERSKDYAAEISAEYRELFMTSKKLDETIEALEAKLKSQPSDVAARLELADFLWRRGDFADAGRHYIQVIRERPEFAHDATIRNRVERNSQGEYIIIEPEELMRRQIAMNPLLIVNENAFNSDRGRAPRREPQYVVTGQVLNRGERILYGVSVNVTLYGFGKVVYDAKSVNIGRMSPGEIRAFSVTCSTYENADNISGHESVATFSQ